MNRFLVLACAFAAVVVAIVAIGRLQAEATQGRDAELQLTALRLDIAQIQDVPWGASPDEGDDPDDVRGELSDDQQRIATSLIALSRESRLDCRAITAPLERGMTALWQVFDVVSKGGSADDAGAASSAAAHELSAADEALQAAAQRYRSDSTRALTRARLQSVAVITLLFGAFALCFWRIAKARRVAERLVEENGQLLKVTQAEALTDSLTGLGNRRALRADLAATAEERLTLALFDLNGFKQYNDTFGHPAGDALLARLGERLATTMEGIGTAYRMGGDEFCILAPAEDLEAGAIASLAASALTESGDGFAIECAYGIASMPGDTTQSDHALSLADQRMYEHKSFGRAERGRESADVLLRVLAESDIELEQHTADVAALAELTALELGVEIEETRRIRLAAELHDVGKSAIPDAILNKPSTLDADEWAFIRRHTIIGERIVRAAASLAHTADLVRWHHERFDGEGYPDRLAGADIPLGARIIAVSDAFDAMVADRPYCAGIPASDALAELRRCAGGQFDPAVVEAFAAVLAAVPSS